MSTPSDNPTSIPVATPAPSAPKPAYKVTRSPFAPKITGIPAAASTAAPTSTGPNPMSIGTSSALSAAPMPGLTRKTVSARSAPTNEASAPLVVLDLIAAAVAVAAAVMLGLEYYKH